MMMRMTLKDKEIRYATNCVANFDPNFIISEISVNQVKKCFPGWGLGSLLLWNILSNVAIARGFSAF